MAIPPVQYGFGIDVPGEERSLIHRDQSMSVRSSGASVSQSRAHSEIHEELGYIKVRVRNTHTHQVYVLEVREESKIPALKIKIGMKSGIASNRQWLSIGGTRIYDDSRVRDIPRIRTEEILLSQDTIGDHEEIDDKEELIRHSTMTSDDRKLFRRIQRYRRHAQFACFMAFIFYLTELIVLEWILHGFGHFSAVHFSFGFFPMCFFALLFFGISIYSLFIGLAMSFLCFFWCAAWWVFGMDVMVANFNGNRVRQREKGIMWLVVSTLAIICIGFSLRFNMHFAHLRQPQKRFLRKNSTARRWICLQCICDICKDPIERYD